MDDELLSDGSPPHPKKYRNRAAYNRALKEARDAYWAECAKDHTFPSHTTWDHFRPKFIAKAMAAIPDGRRGRPPNPNPTERQRYQQIYQKARRDAEAYVLKNTKLRGKYRSFSEYWSENKHTWLPEGFIRRSAGRPLTPKRQSGAKDARSKYQIVYHHHRRCWEFNIGEVWERFKSWENYWTYVKVNGFVPADGTPEAAPIENVVEHEDLEFPALSIIPPGWIGRNAPEPAHTQASPITRPALPMPVAVYLETDVIPDNSEWLAAA